MKRVKKLESLKDSKFQAFERNTIGELCQIFGGYRFYNTFKNGEVVDCRDNSTNDNSTIRVGAGTDQWDDCPSSPSSIALF